MTGTPRTVTAPPLGLRASVVEGVHVRFSVGAVGAPGMFSGPVLDTRTVTGLAGGTCAEPVLATREIAVAAPPLTVVTTASVPEASWISGVPTIRLAPPDAMAAPVQTLPTASSDTVAPDDDRYPPPTCTDPTGSERPLPSTEKPRARNAVPVRSTL